MRYWLWFLGVVGLGGTALWFAGAISLTLGVRGWFDAQEQAGWVVAHSEVETLGFPTQFNTEIRDLELADPHTGWSWQAPWFRLSQVAWRPQDLRAEFPPISRFSTPFESLDIETETQARLHVAPSQHFALQAVEWRMGETLIQSDLGWQSRWQSAELIASLLDGTEQSYELLIEAQEVEPARILQQLLDPAGILPTTIAQMRYEAVMQFARPWDLSAIELSRPAIRRIELAELSADWGRLSLRLAGDLDVDENGIPEGELRVRAENWQEILELGVNAGLVPELMQGTLETGLAFVAGLSGRPEDIETSLSFTAGEVFLGPINLGPAPILLLR